MKYNSFDYHTYYINLDSRKDRNNNVIHQAKKQNLKVIRYPAIYGKTINKNILNKIPNYILKKIDYNKKPGQLGCYLSHCNLYKQILENKHKNILILEDDIEFCHNFKHKLKIAVSQLPKDWDVLLINKKFLNNNPNLDYSKDLIQVLDDFWGTGGYLVNSRSTNKLYNDICSYEDITEPIDVKLSNIFKTNYNVYATKYNLITQSKNNNITKTDIQLKN